MIPLKDIIAELNKTMPEDIFEKLMGAKITYMQRNAYTNHIFKTEFDVGGILLGERVRIFNIDELIIPVEVVVIMENADAESWYLVGEDLFLMISSDGIITDNIKLTNKPERFSDIIDEINQLRLKKISPKEILEDGEKGREILKTIQSIVKDAGLDVNVNIKKIDLSEENIKDMPPELVEAMKHDGGVPIPMDIAINADSPEENDRVMEKLKALIEDTINSGGLFLNADNTMGKLIPMVDEEDAGRLLGNTIFIRFLNAKDTEFKAIAFKDGAESLSDLKIPRSWKLPDGMTIVLLGNLMGPLRPKKSTEYFVCDRAGVSLYINEEKAKRWNAINIETLDNILDFIFYEMLKDLRRAGLIPAPLIGKLIEKLGISSEFTDEQLEDVEEDDKIKGNLFEAVKDHLHEGQKIDIVDGKWTVKNSDGSSIFTDSNPYESDELPDDFDVDALLEEREELGDLSDFKAPFEFDGDFDG